MELPQDALLSNKSGKVLVSKWGKLIWRSVTSPIFFPTENKVPKMWVGYVGVCLREITSWLWINQERNDRSSCHYVEKHDLFISVCDYSCDGKCDLRCVTTNIISLTALAHNRTKRQPFCLAPSQCASILIVWHLNPRFIQHLWCHTKRSCHMLSFCPALTENALFCGTAYDSHLPLRMFQTLLSNS